LGFVVLAAHAQVQEPPPLVKAFQLCIIPKIEKVNDGKTEAIALADRLKMECTNEYNAIFQVGPGRTDPQGYGSNRATIQRDLVESMITRLRAAGRIK